MTARRLGWVLFGVTCALCATQLALLVASGVPMLSAEVLVEMGFPLVSIAAMVGAAFGAMIVAREPHNAVGWLLAVGQLGSAIGLASDAGLVYLRLASGTGTTPPGLLVFGQLFNLIYVMTFLALVFLLVPDGHVRNRRWRFTPLLPITALLLESVVILTIPASDFYAPKTADFGWLTTALVLGSNVLVGVSIALGAVSVRRRLAEATGQQRQQLRWLAAAANMLAVIFAVTLVVGALLPPTAWLTWIISILLYLAYIFVFVAVGVATLRYGLYEVDIVLSRAIVLAVLAVFVTIGYIAIVVAIGAVTTGLGTFGWTGPGPAAGTLWTSLVATALVAIAFQPLRRHVLTLADRLVYGERAVPYEALAALSRELARRPSPDAVPARVAEATGRAVGAVSAEAEVGPPGSPLARATWTRETGAAPARAGGETLTVPVVDLGDTVGCVTVTMPPGRRLRTFERQLLGEVGRQAGVAFRGALLEAELADRVRQIEAQSAELAESRRRLVRAEDEAREELAGDIARRVVPHLRLVSVDLARPVDDTGLAARIEQDIGTVEVALDELRAVVRGVFPALLERRGLVPALSAELDRRPQITLEATGLPDDRFDRAVEAAAYLFCVWVAPTDRPATIRLAADALALTVEVVTDSPNTVAQPAASSWQHVRDRVAALDGTTSIVTEGHRVLVRAMLPLPGQPERARAVAQTAANLSGPNDDFGT